MIHDPSASPPPEEAAAGSYGKEYYADYDEPPEEEVYYPLPEYDERLKYAGFQARMMATICDMMIVMLGVHFLVQPLFGLLGLGGDPVNDTFEMRVTRIVITNGLQVVIYIVYCLLCWLKWGNTPGKMLCAQKIVHADTGATPVRGQFIIRAIFYPLSAIPAMLGFFWIIFHYRKQGWHDRASYTVVIIDKSHYRMLGQWLKRKAIEKWQNWQHKT